MTGSSPLFLVSKWSRLAYVTLNRLSKPLVPCLLFVALLPLLQSIVTGLYKPKPYPTVHDEFSYLLAADTLAHGKLANPSPPSPAHFESMHILVQPTYASKYPIGQSAFLALGIRFFGHPYWGVVLETSLLCGASLWAMRAFMAPGFALLGTLAAWSTFGFAHYWASSYWGGSVAFAGAMLSLGATKRIISFRQPSSAWLLALGLMLLFFTRPFEGGVLGFVLFSIILLCACCEKSFRPTLAKSLPPLLLMAVACLLVQLRVNSAITGKPFVLPYVEHMRQYQSAPSLWAFPPDLSPKLGGEALQLQRATELAQSVRKESFPFSFIVGLLRVYSLVPLTRTPTAFVFLFLLLVAYNKAARPLILLACLLAVVNALVTWTFAHYLAPLIALCWILFFSLLGNLRSLRFRRILVGPWLVLFCLGVSFAGSIAENAIYLTDLKKPTPTGRQLIQNFLEAQPGNHLVLIRRHQPYILNEEWIYNDANIEQSRILWVRDLDENANQALFHYYPGRRIWLCEPEIVPTGAKTPRLIELAARQ